MNVKFHLGIQPDSHTIGGAVIGYNVVLVGHVRTPGDANQLADWIQQALKEKAGANSCGLILPANIVDIGPPKPRNS